MTPGRTEELFRRPREAADVIAELHALDTVLDATAQRHADRRQARPQTDVAQPRRAMNHVAFPQFLTASVGLLRPSHAELQTREVGLQSRVETVLDILVQVRLVVLDREQVIPTTGDDPGSY